MNILKRILLFLGIFLLFGCGFILNNLSDRHPNYSINLSIKDDQSHAIKAGFAKVPITPSGFDTWNDVWVNKSIINWFICLILFFIISHIE